MPYRFHLLILVIILSGVTIFTVSKQDPISNSESSQVEKESQDNIDTVTNTKAAVEAKARQAQKDIHAVTEFIDEYSSSLNEKVQESINAHLITARKHYTNGQGALTSSEYSKAMQHFQSAVFLARQAMIL